jgi:hypothetical protein
MMQPITHPIESSSVYNKEQGQFEGQTILKEVIKSVDLNGLTEPLQKCVGGEER